MSQEIILFEKTLKTVNSYLKWTGLHLISDNNDESFISRLRRRWFLCFVFIWVNSDLASEIAWFVDGAVKGKPLVELTYPAPAIATSVLSNVKAYYYLKYEPNVNDLISTLQQLQSITIIGNIREKVEEELITRMSFLVKVTKMQYWFSTIALSGFAILPFIVMGLTYYEKGVIELMLPYLMLLPIDVTDIRYWPFCYLRQMWSASLIVFAILGIDSLYYACCTYIQIQFRYLSFDIERIISRKKMSNTDFNNFRTQFETCIKRHTELIRCVCLMEQIYSKSTLLNVVSSSMLICLTGFNVTAMESWHMLMPFVGFVFMVSSQIYLFCYFGDIIMKSSSEISDAAYNSYWYNADIRVKRNLLFVLTRAQKPCKLTAYGFADINLITFTRILSTAWSYFALLSTVNN